MALAHELGYLPSEVYRQITVHAQAPGKQLSSYVADLKLSKQGEKEMPSGYTIHEKIEPYLFHNLDKDFLNYSSNPFLLGFIY